MVFVEEFFHVFRRLVTWNTVSYTHLSGSSTLEFAMEAQHCGLIQLQMERLKLWDYLSLFFTKRNMAEQMELAVFPEEKMLKIAPFAGSWGESSPVEEQLVSRAGDACHEIRQIREYSTGDSNRHIHWNLSTRTDQLWIKEYEKETNSQAQLLLDLEDVASATREEKSAFYQLLSALVLGLLEQVASVQVHWPVKEGGFFMAEVANQEQCRSMLLLLYRQEGEQGEKFPERVPEELGEHYYQLDGKLRWYQEGQLICQFTGEGLAREIQEKTFVI